MNKPYSFNQDQMNGIVEEIYANIMKECESLKNETNCPNEQVVAPVSYTHLTLPTIYSV